MSSLQSIEFQHGWLIDLAQVDTFDKKTISYINRMKPPIFSWLFERRNYIYITWKIRCSLAYNINVISAL
jgi:hypothetical protein